MVGPQELLSEIKAGKFYPAYYFFGVEDYRIAEAEKFVARQFLPDRQLPTNLRKIDGKKTPCADVIAELSTLPLLGERQVTIVRDFQSYSPTEVKRILAMLTPPDTSRLVIFSSPSSAMPRGRAAFMKKAFFTNVSKAARTVEFKHLPANQVASMVSSRLKAEGIEIDADARELLTGLLAGNRGGLETEIDKLVNFKQRGETVTVEDIRELSAGYEVFSVFELADNIVEGNTSRTLKMIRSLIADGNPAPAIGTLLQQHFLCVYLVKNGKKPLKGRDMPFLVRKFQRQGEMYENERLERIIVDIADTDAAFRKGGVKPETELEMLALRLVTLGRPAGE